MFGTGAFGQFEVGGQPSFGSGARSAAPTAATFGGLYFAEVGGLPLPPTLSPAQTQNVQVARVVARTLAASQAQARARSSTAPQSVATAQAQGPWLGSVQGHLALAGQSQALALSAADARTLARSQAQSPTRRVLAPATVTLTQAGSVALRSADARVLTPSLNYAGQVTGDGPLAYWRLDAPPVVGPGQQTDIVSGRIATTTGAFDFGAPGALARDADTALLLAGSGYLSAPPLAALQSLTALSVEAWVSTPSTGATQALVAQWAGNKGFLLRINASNHASFYLNATQLAPSPSNAPCDGRWHHIVGVWDGATMYLYLDGSLVGSTAFAGPITAPTAPLTLGAYSGAGFLVGTLDEPAVYPVALSAAQITRHYQLGAGLASARTGQMQAAQFSGARVNLRTLGATAAQTATVAGLLPPRTRAVAQAQGGAQATAATFGGVPFGYIAGGIPLAPPLRLIARAFTATSDQQPTLAGPPPTLAFTLTQAGTATRVLVAMRPFSAAQTTATLACRGALRAVVVSGGQAGVARRGLARALSGAQAQASPNLSRRAARALGAAQNAGTALTRAIATGARVAQAQAPARAAARALSLALAQAEIALGYRVPVRRFTGAQMGALAGGRAMQRHYAQTQAASLALPCQVARAIGNSQGQDALLITPPPAGAVLLTQTTAGALVAAPARLQRLSAAQLLARRVDGARRQGVTQDASAVMGATRGERRTLGASQPALCSTAAAGARRFGGGQSTALRVPRVVAVAFVRAAAQAGRVTRSPAARLATSQEQATATGGLLPSRRRFAATAGQAAALVTGDSRTVGVGQAAVVFCTHPWWATFAVTQAQHADVPLPQLPGRVSTDQTSDGLVVTSASPGTVSDGAGRLLVVGAVAGNVAGATGRLQRQSARTKLAVAGAVAGQVIAQGGVLVVGTETNGRTVVAPSGKIKITQEER